MCRRTGLPKQVSHDLQPFCRYRQKTGWLFFAPSLSESMEDAVTQENAPPPHPNVEGGNMIQTISSVWPEIVFDDLINHAIDGYCLMVLLQKLQKGIGCWSWLLRAYGLVVLMLT
jgi:hypothetical protein